MNKQKTYLVLASVGVLALLGGLWQARSQMPPLITSSHNAPMPNQTAANQAKRDWLAVDPSQNPQPEHAQANSHGSSPQSIPLNPLNAPMQLSPELQSTLAGKQSAAEQARTAALTKLGYFIAERYYQLPLSQLRQQAQAGDVQAQTHLAERYLFALDGQPQQPDFQSGFNYREAARQLLQQAYRQGNLHAAAIISESYLQEKRPLDATAWHLIAKQAGDHLSADWFVQTKDYRALTEAQKANASKMATQLLAKLQQPEGNS